MERWNIAVPRYGEGERGVLERNVLVLQAFQELFEVLIFGLGSQILGFKVSEFIFKLERSRQGMNKRGTMGDSHP
jgi:hypothetical protein